MAEVRGSSVVIGIFDERQEAERAVDELRREGYEDRQLGFACPDEEGGAEFVSQPGKSTEPGKDAEAGIAGGGILGGALGAAAAGVIPGVGPIVAVGALTGILGGAAIGGASGAFAAVMKEMGVDEQIAQTCEEQMRAGRSIVTVQTDEESESAARSILVRNGADDLRGRAA